MSGEGRGRSRRLEEVPCCHGVNITPLLQHLVFRLLSFHATNEHIRQLLHSRLQKLGCIQTWSLFAFRSSVRRIISRIEMFMFTHAGFPEIYDHQKHNNPRPENPASRDKHWGRCKRSGSNAKIYTKHVNQKHYYQKQKHYYLLIPTQESS